MIDREDWQAVAAAFAGFFAGAGDVTVDGEVLRFDGSDAGTGLELRRDGTSRSFMPLHGLDARWQRVEFDREHDRVVLEGDGVRYAYRVPPALRS